MGIDMAAEETGIVYEATEQIPVGGVTYEHKSLLTEDGWVDIHVMSMPLDDEDVALEIIRDQVSFGQGGGLSEMTDQGESFAGGINGSFFSMGAALGEIVGLEAQDGTLTYVIDDYNFYSDNGATFFMTEEGPQFDFLNISLTLETGAGQSFRIQGINTRSVGGEPVVFNRNAYEDTEVINQLGDLYKVIVEDGVITAVIKDDQVVEIPENGYVVVFRSETAPSYTPYLKKGKEVELKQVSNFNEEDLSLAITGGGFILRDGEAVTDGLIVGTNQRHPRTAVGVDEDDNLFYAMVVDGRGESIGATHDELAEYLKDYGVDHAIHMDGGGSSTMVARELGAHEVSVMNEPSDGRERSVVNGLGVVLTAPEDDDLRLYLQADQTRVFINNPITLTLRGTDGNFNPVSIDDDKVGWSISGGYGSLDGNVFTPKVSGEIKLTAQYKGENKSITIDVTDELIDLEVYPKVAHHEDGTQIFTVIGTDPDGYKTVINNKLLDWEISDPVGSVKDGVFVSDGQASARIDVRYGSIKEVAYVVSGETRKTAVLIDKNHVSTLVYPETVSGNTEVNLGTLNISYSFQPSEASQAVYAVFEEQYLTKEVTQMALELVDDFPEDVLVRAQLSDRFDERYTMTFTDYGDGNIKGDMPPGMAYPVAFERLYVVTLPADDIKEGSLSVKAIESIAKLTERDLEDVIHIAPMDDLYESYPDEDSFTIGIFGATAGRNRLLDEVVMNKVYDVFNATDFAVYAGRSDVDEEEVTNQHLVYDDSFSVTDLEDARIITLAMSQGSVVKTDADQWNNLWASLASTVQETIVIVGTEPLVNNGDQSFTKEGQLIHDLMSDYQRKSNKTIFYINASQYSHSLSFYEGIRYIDLNGLWYKVGTDHGVDLYDSFQTLMIDIGPQGVTYRVEDLYPKTTVSNN